MLSHGRGREGQHLEIASNDPEFAVHAGADARQHARRRHRSSRQAAITARKVPREACVLFTEPSPRCSTPTTFGVWSTLMDHVRARRALLGFYEDHPYLHGQRGDAGAAEIGRRNECFLRRASLAVDVAAKTRRVAAYASQLDDIRRADPSLMSPRTREILVAFPGAGRPADS